jgi:hypothetical protein
MGNLRVGRSDADEFFNWAFCGQGHDTRASWTNAKCYGEMQKRLGLTFAPTGDNGWKLDRLPR